MFIGIDVGTSSIKATIGAEGSSSTITEPYSPGIFAGHSHLVPQFKQSLESICRNVRGFCSEHQEKIEAIGFCGHGPSIVLIDRGGTPLTDILTWRDGSAFEEARQLGKVLPGFSKDGTCFEAKLFKLFRENPRLFESPVKALAPKDYAIFLLTGQKVLDYSTATTLSFFQDGSRQFDMHSTGIPPESFPRVIESWEVAGVTDTAFARSCGLEPDIPVVCGGIDTWCEALGAGAVKDGMLVDGSGTSTCLTRCKEANQTPLAHVIPGKTIQIETMSSTGASLAWLKSLVQEDLEGLKRMADPVPVPILYFPYLEGERSPVWDEKASASFTGITSRDGRENLVRSVFQGIALGTRQCFASLEPEPAAAEKTVRAVGGGGRNRPLLQFKADITGISYHAMKETNAASLGAMILAAFGTGRGRLTDLADQWNSVEGEILPDPEYKEIWDRLYETYSAHYARVQQTAHDLYEIKQILGKPN